MAMAMAMDTAMDTEGMEMAIMKQKTKKDFFKKYSKKNSFLFMLTSSQQSIKRMFDVVFSFFIVLVLGIPILLLIVFAGFSTKMSGLFCQKRIGKNGKPFIMYKIRTLKGLNHQSVQEIKNLETSFGHWLRKTKLDELPQFINVLIGDMSIVGPRPDITGYADKLKGEDKIILSIRPGITGPATLKYKNEEEVLLQQENPQYFNDMVIWPDKVKINKEYVANWSFAKDLKYIYASLASY
jgi:lipopolysaccharide/colanic/teichoic acid biosynthesis glycosyltransferase